MLFLKRLFCSHDFYSNREAKGVVDIEPEEGIIYEKINVRCGNCNKIMRSYLEKRQINNKVSEEV